MKTIKNVKENFAEVCDSSGRRNTTICNIYHILSEFIPDEVDADTLVTAFKIVFADYERYKPGELLNHLSVIPRTVRDISDEEFYLEFWQKYNEKILGQLRMIPPLKEPCNEIEHNVIDISKKDRNAVLAALYNAAIPIGMGLAEYSPVYWDEQYAEAAFEHFGEPVSNGGIYLGWVLGRPLKCTFYRKKVFVGHYNHEQAPGLAQRVIAALPDKNEQKKAQQKQKK